MRNFIQIGCIKTWRWNVDVRSRTNRFSIVNRHSMSDLTDSIPMQPILVRCVCETITIRPVCDRLISVFVYKYL